MGRQLKVKTKIHALIVQVENNGIKIVIHALVLLENILQMTEIHV
jgi:hypothetical protein